MDVVGMIESVANAVAEVFRFLQTPEGQTMLKENRVNWQEFVTHSKEFAEWLKNLSAQKA